MPNAALECNSPCGAKNQSDTGRIPAKIGDPGQIGPKAGKAGFRQLQIGLSSAN
jgi:hypothetical protein